jgi:hypothetical protein
MSFTVTRQDTNCGPMRRLFDIKTIEEARHAFDIAVEQGAYFANIHDETLDCEVLRHLEPVRWSRY